MCLNKDRFITCSKSLNNYFIWFFIWFNWFNLRKKHPLATFFQKRPKHIKPGTIFGPFILTVCKLIKEQNVTQPQPHPHTYTPICSASGNIYYQKCPSTRFCPKAWLCQNKAQRTFFWKQNSTKTLFFLVLGDTMKM